MRLEDRSLNLKKIPIKSVVSLAAGWILINCNFFKSKEIDGKSSIMHYNSIQLFDTLSAL